MTDRLFERYLQQISQNKSLFFTEKQFHYFLDRKFRAKIDPYSNANKINIIIIASVIIVAIVILWIDADIGSIIVPALVLLAILYLFIKDQIISLFRLLDRATSSIYPLRERRRSANILQFLVCLVGGMILFAGIASNSPIFYLLGSAVGLSAIWGGYFIKKRFLPLSSSTTPLRKRKPSLPPVAPAAVSPEQAQSWLTKWYEIHPTLPLLFSPNAAQNNTSTQSFRSPDITAYSFDRAVICDKASIAQILIANNFHFEYNCAILSLDGYPREIFSTVREMLQRNDNLQVYALHDLSPQGICLVPTLKNRQAWFRDSSATLIDVGLTPQQIAISTAPFQVRSTSQSADTAQRLPSDIRATLTDEEFAWFVRGNFVELESFTPLKLIQILRGAIAGTGVVMTDFSETAEGSGISLVCYSDETIDTFG